MSGLASPSCRRRSRPAVRARWPGIGARWCEQAERELVELCEHYDARPVAGMRSPYGLVVEVMAGGQPLVFRGSPDPAGVNQGRVATALADLGVGPTVHAFIETATGTWTVTDRIYPGTPIGDMNPTTIDFRKVCAMLRPLVGQPAPASDMPTLTGWLRSRSTDDALNDLAREVGVDRNRVGRWVAVASTARV